MKRNGVAISILNYEIKRESFDDNGAKMVILFAVGGDCEGPQQHLQVLSEFARMLAKADVVQTTSKQSAMTMSLRP